MTQFFSEKATGELGNFEKRPPVEISEDVVCEGELLATFAGAKG